MGMETWVEAWQGGSDACAAPVSPHDGTSMGAFSYDEVAGTLMIDGRDRQSLVSLQLHRN